MANKDKLERYILLKSEHPELSDRDAALKAGYSRRRISSTVSDLRRNIRVKARLEAIRNQQLSTAPDKTTFYTLVNLAIEHAKRHENANSAWTLTQLAQLVGRDMLQQSEPKQKQSASVVVSFVESELPPEEAQAINKFVSQFEASAGLPQGWSGRLMPEPQVIQAQSPPLMPAQARSEGAVLLLPIPDAERRRLERVCLPVGGALRTHHCRVHGDYESIWQQRADQTWGWSDCPACWEPVAAIQ